MKKYLSTIVIVFCIAGMLPLFASTYDNNEFQRKSRSYSELATKAYDNGEYDNAVEYAREAEKNAVLSAAFIENAIIRSETEALLYKAHTRLSWAKEKNAEKFFPDAFTVASDAVADADNLFAKEDYQGTKLSAESALEALSVIREVIPLPAFYTVELWASSKDCFWNIALNPAVYGNPLEWERLYMANKKSLDQPSNPNLLQPGMIVTIPSIQGEYREGYYDSSIKYDPLPKKVK